MYENIIAQLRVAFSQISSEYKVTIEETQSTLEKPKATIKIKFEYNNSGKIKAKADEIGAELGKYFIGCNVLAFPSKSSANTYFIAILPDQAIPSELEGKSLENLAQQLAYVLSPGSFTDNFELIISRCLRVLGELHAGGVKSSSPTILADGSQQKRITLAKGCEITAVEPASVSPVAASVSPVAASATPLKYLEPQIKIIYDKDDLNKIVLQAIYHVLKEHGVGEGVAYDTTTFASEHHLQIKPFATTTQTTTYDFQKPKNFAALVSASAEWTEFLQAVKDKYESLSKGVSVFTTAALVNAHLLNLVAGDNPDMRLEFKTDGALIMRIAPGSTAIPLALNGAAAPNATLYKPASATTSTTTTSKPAVPGATIPGASNKPSSCSVQ